MSPLVAGLFGPVAVLFGAIGIRGIARSWRSTSVLSRLGMLWQRDARRRSPIEPPSWFVRRVTDFELPLAPSVLWHRYVAGSVAVVVIGAMVGGPPAVLACFGGLVAAPTVAVRVIRNRRARRIEGQLPVLLDGVGAALRSGASFHQAMLEAACGAPPPLRHELAPMVRATNAGGSLVDELEAWSARNPSPAVRMVVAASTLGLRHGGAQVHTVEGVAATVRDRLSVAGEVRALSTQARASALVIVIAPILFASVSAVVDPTVLQFLVTTAMGAACLAGGLALNGVGALVDGADHAERGMSVGAGLVCGGVMLVGAWFRRPPAARLREMFVASSPRRERASRLKPHEWLRPIDVVLRGAGRVRRRAAGLSADDLRDRRLGLALLSGMTAATVALPLAVPAAIVAWWTPWFLQNRHRRRQGERVLDELPDAVDLLRLALGSGTSLRLALCEVAPRCGPTIGARIAAVDGRVAFGAPLVDALAELDALGEPFRPVLDALVIAERHGAPIVPLLDRLAADARAARRRRAEERARHTPVKLLFPLVFCTLPAFGLLTVVPLLASALGRFAALSRLPPIEPRLSRLSAPRHRGEVCRPPFPGVVVAMVKFFVFVQSWFEVHLARFRRLARDRGQTTAEYALVLVGVAAIALLVLAWATKTGAIGKLFDFVLDHVMGSVK